MKHVLALVLSVLVAAAEVHADTVRATAERLRDQALDDTTAWNILESLTTEIGARPVGSPAMERAKDWPSRS